MGPRSKKERNSAASTTNGTQNTREITSKNHDRLEQLQADHELFLQAFESKY